MRANNFRTNAQRCSTLPVQGKKFESHCLLDSRAIRNNCSYLERDKTPPTCDNDIFTRASITRSVAVVQRPPERIRYIHVVYTLYVFFFFLREADMHFSIICTFFIPHIERLYVSEYNCVDSKYWEFHMYMRNDFPMRVVQFRWPMHARALARLKVRWLRSRPPFRITVRPEYLSEWRPALRAERYSRDSWIRYTMWSNACGCIIQSRPRWIHREGWS